MYHSHWQGAEMELVAKQHSYFTQEVKLAGGSAPTSAPTSATPFRDSLAAHSGFGLVVLEFPGRDPLHEHLIELLETAVCCLGLIEPQVDEGEHREAAENIGDLGAQIGLVRVEEVR